MIFKWQRNYKSVTVRNKRSKIPPSTSVHFATGVRRSRVVRRSWSSRYFMLQQHKNCEPAIRLVYPPFFCKPYSSSKPTNKNVKELVLEVLTAVSRYPFPIRHMFVWTSVSQWPILSPPKILTFLLNRLVCAVLPAFKWESWYFALRFYLFASLLYEENEYLKWYTHWCNSQILPEHSVLSENAVRFDGKCLSVISFTSVRKIRPPLPQHCVQVSFTQFNPNWTMNANMWAKVMLVSLSEA